MKKGPLSVNCREFRNLQLQDRHVSSTGTIGVAAAVLAVFCTSCAWQGVMPDGVAVDPVQAALQRAAALRQRCGQSKLETPPGSYEYVLG